MKLISRSFSTLARAKRESRLSAAGYQALKRSFLRDWNGINIVDLASAVLAPAAALIERHALRGYDAVRLCSALWLGQPRVACFDLRLRHAAAAEGLAVVP